MSLRCEKNMLWSLGALRGSAELGREPRHSCRTSQVRCQQTGAALISFFSFRWFQMPMLLDAQKTSKNLSVNYWECFWFPFGYPFSARRSLWRASSRASHQTLQVCCMCFPCTLWPLCFADVNSQQCAVIDFPLFMARQLQLPRFHSLSRYFAGRVCRIRHDTTTYIDLYC